MNISSQEVTTKIADYSDKMIANTTINPDFYNQYHVFRGLRDLNGNGVLTGLTEISEIKSKEIVDGKEIPCEGKLYYRGVDIEDIVKSCIKEKRFGYEEVCYLLLFGELPTQAQLDEFKNLLFSFRPLPPNFVRDVVMKRPEEDVMNVMSRCILMLHSYDDRANDISIPNVLRQSLQLIAQLPLLCVYAYQAYVYSIGQSFCIHYSDPSLSTAENFLSMLREDRSYTPLEAYTLDIALLLHADHGGGNNSTFTNHLLSSAATDTYSTFSASLGSLKGPKHGGANSKVVMMFDDMKREVKDWEDEDEIRSYLSKLLNREAFDKAGLIYGMGHAVYSISDPRAKVFKYLVKNLSQEKGRDKEYDLYNKVERLAPEVIAEKRHIYKGVSVNVDFYSGFVYNMLNLPLNLYTPIFAIGRIPGWGAHRIEELINSNKIIRPSYKNVKEHQPYLPIDQR